MSHVYVLEFCYITFLNELLFEMRVIICYIHFLNTAERLEDSDMKFNLQVR